MCGIKAELGTTVTKKRSREMEKQGMREAGGGEGGIVKYKDTCA